MRRSIGIVGAGVSGLTCGALLAENGFRVTIFAAETTPNTTSAAAGAIWFPYDAEPAEAVIRWALGTYGVLRDLSADAASGVSMIELREFRREGVTEIPSWAHSLGARLLPPTAVPHCFASGFSLEVPLTDTTIYLDYLADCLREAGGEIHGDHRLETLEELDRGYDLLVNCAGLGAKTLVPDAELEPHRGQIAVVAKLELAHALVCNDPLLMYAIPRRNDCVFGGTNEISAELLPDPASTARIVAECSRALGIAPPPVIAERVGLRPFRRSGICLRRGLLADGRPVIHNYGHGGSGFTLSWGCARELLALALAA
jgi:D-amino-acid oxidase